MNINTQEQWRAWRDAAKRDAIDLSLRSFYTDLDTAVAERGAVCNASGRCCKFESYGHRLYVTGLEIAWFMQAVVSRQSGVGTDTSTSQSRFSLQQFSSTPNPQTLTPNCPYQIDGLCSTHTIRPLGCRVYFCEEGTEDWQQDTTELFLARLKTLHTEHDLPYVYMEWRAGLAEAGRVMDASI